MEYRSACLHGLAPCPRLPLSSRHEQVNVESSCSMSLPESPTRTFPTGTETWSVSVKTFPSCCVVTRLTSRSVCSFSCDATSLGDYLLISFACAQYRSERSRPRELLSTERRTCSITRSPRSRTTTSKSLSCGWPGSLLGTYM
jgi:hypothetical protein